MHGGERGLTVASWTVQLLTILGVAVGAMASFVSTRLLDRARWQREETLRWDARRLENYSEFAAAMKHFITLGQRLCATRGLPATGQPLDLDTGLTLLAEAEQALGVKWEQILMLGAPEAIRAARDWRYSAWHLEWLVCGLRGDAAEIGRAT